MSACHQHPLLTHILCLPLDTDIDCITSSRTTCLMLRNNPGSKTDEPRTNRLKKLGVHTTIFERGSRLLAGGARPDDDKLNDDTKNNICHASELKNNDR
jgi:hypothetical protein